ncbi:MAG: helix-turn-helix transcriptional regulator [Verrucomicrobia bacterium]|nr:helix-turn-helix transcriptional regulator [Verrucomicrobiota bacterium]
MKEKPGKNRRMENVVGHLLRRHRMEAGLTQKELAAHCQSHGLNLTRGTLAKIEARVRFIKADELFILAKILNVPLERFFPSDFACGKKNPAR